MRKQKENELFVTAADISRKKTNEKNYRTEEEEAFVKNKRVTHIRAKEKPKSSIFYDTERTKKKKNENRRDDACTERFNKSIIC